MTTKARKNRARLKFFDGILGNAFFFLTMGGIFSIVAKNVLLGLLLITLAIGASVSRNYLSKKFLQGRRARHPRGVQQPHRASTAPHSQKGNVPEYGFDDGSGYKFR